MNFGPILRIGLYVLAAILGIVVTYNLMNSLLFKAYDPQRKDTVLVEISPGMSFSDVSKKIKKAEVVRYAKSLQLIARLKGMDTAIKPGEYVLSPSMTPREVLKALEEAKIFKRQVEVNAGDSIWDLAPRIEKAGLVSQDEFNKSLTKPALLARAGIASESFEGYLYPGKYEYSRPITADKIIWTMLEKAEENWPPEYTDKANNLRLSRHEVITLASIIQKETDKESETKVISSVFHNRLNQGMKLQADTTVIYGIKDFSGILTQQDLTTPSPYNTYLNFGLPPGPICNPGKVAVEAALDPQKTTYLFYLKDGSGGHKFASTQREYNEEKQKLLESLVD